MGVMQEFRSAWGEESPAVRKKIGSRARTIDHDEFRSSKLSLAVVTSEFQGLEDPCDRFTILVVTRLSKQRMSPVTSGIVTVSAAINVLQLFLCFARGQGRPAAFGRENCDSRVSEGVEPNCRNLIDFDRLHLQSVTASKATVRVVYELCEK